MAIDPTAPLPLYAPVEVPFAASIADGTLPPGSRLPSEESLIERFGVSRTTVRPIDYEKLHYRGDQIRFVTRLARRAAAPSPGDTT